MNRLIERERKRILNIEIVNQMQFYCIFFSSYALETIHNTHNCMQFCGVTNLCDSRFLRTYISVYISEVYIIP